MCTHSFRLFLHFFSYFTTADIPNTFFWIVPSQFLLFILLWRACKDIFHRRTLFLAKYCCGPTYLCRIFMISEITGEKSSFITTTLLSKQDLFLHGLADFYVFTSTGFLLVLRAPGSTVTSSTFTVIKHALDLNKINISKNSDISRRLIFTIRFRIFCIHHQVSAGTIRSVSEHQQTGCSNWIVWMRFDNENTS